MCKEGNGHQHDNVHSHNGCGCDGSHGGQPVTGKGENLVQPAILLLLCEDSGTGADIVKRITGYGLNLTVEGHTVVSYLGYLEAQGYVSAQKESGETDPEHTLYEITPKGRDYFRSWTEVLRKRRDLLTFMLTRAEDTFDI